MNLGSLPGPWVADALCAQTDPECYFPEKGGDPRDAIAVCAQCPVRVPCAIWALTHHEAGVWGGLTERQRTQLRRKHQPGTPWNLPPTRVPAPSEHQPRHRPQRKAA